MTINFSNIKFSRYYLLIVVITFVIYGNSINNEYSIDDNIVVKNNKLVEGGIKALPEIFTSRYAVDPKQTYDYRPVVIASFAFEKQFFKHLPPFQTKEEKKRKDKLTQANISHFINVLLYALTCIVIFQILYQLFFDYHILLPLVVTLIFIVHPLHTEVVDNIKSRDEILMFLGMLLSIKYYLKFAETSQLKYLIIAPIFSFLSILAKKDGLAIAGVLPVLMYFKSYNYKKILISFSTIFSLFILFLLLKKQVLTTEQVRNLKFFENPLIFEGGLMDRITVGLYCSLFYLEMLIFPKDLSFYYGYNQIPMATWSNWKVWVSLLVFVPLGIYGVYLFIKRNVLGLGILIWLGIMLSVINVLFPIVGIVADRFTYAFSLGFCIVVGFILLKAFKVDLNKKTSKVNLPNGFVVVFAGILVVYSLRTIIRNPNWHDQVTLYAHDVEHLTESAKANALYSNILYPIVAKEIATNPGNPKNKENINKIIFHYKEALRIDSNYLTTINNLGSAYMNFHKDYDKTIYYCQKAVDMDEEYMEAHFNLAYSYDVKGNYKKAMYHYSRVIEINPEYMKAYESFNVVVNKYKKVKEGIDLLKKSAEKVDRPKNIYLDIGNLYSLDNYNVQQSIVYFIKAFELDKSDKKLCFHIATLYNSIGDKDKADFYFSLCGA
jgi:hypothetical protein